MVVARWRAHGILRALVLTWRLPCQVDHVWRDVGILLGIAAVFKLLFCVLFFRKTTSMSEPRVPTASEQVSRPTSSSVLCFTIIVIVTFIIVFVVIARRQHSHPESFLERATMLRTEIPGASRWARPQIPTQVLSHALVRRDALLGVCMALMPVLLPDRCNLHVPDVVVWPYLQLSMHKMTGGSVHAPLVVGTAFGQNLPPFVQVMN